VYFPPHQKKKKGGGRRNSLPLSQEGKYRLLAPASLTGGKRRKGGGGVLSIYVKMPGS